MAKSRLEKSLGNYSYNDLQQELASIVQQKYGKKSQTGDYWVDYPYIVDVYEDEFVVEKDGKYYIADYEVDEDGTVSIGSFYAAKKIYSKKGKTPVTKLGSRPSASSEIASV
ncbi:hypothetical protein LSG31_00490 [Fodinisporobacter ferrooxydans]|uniref:Phage protein n=1 Tax=Fodinisporobacter ferrooxydans TaxID=2901836 RepID=A0ABY4CMP3_9BACL|nr:hypothetical protein LSG31_00490 [Alicyclobacillaceae bacterium MYW30-H2]